MIKYKKEYKEGYNTAILDVIMFLTGVFLLYHIDVNIQKLIFDDMEKFKIK